jgi:hypothetical protein
MCSCVCFRGSATCAIGFAGRVQADELGRQRPPVRLDLGACLEHDRDAIQRAVRVELGADAADDARAVAVRVECAADGRDAGVVLEVRQPGSPRRYLYALDWRAQPLDARPRLIGLAVAEAVDASQIELTAVPEPPPAPGPASIGTPRATRVVSAWTISLVGERRAFRARGGVDLLGFGLMPSRRLSTHVHLAGDLLAEGATVLTDSGAVAVRSLSAARASSCMPAATCTASSASARASASYTCKARRCHIASSSASAWFAPGSVRSRPSPLAPI